MKRLAFSLLALSALLVFTPRAYAAWVAVDDFNSYSDGLLDTLNGGSGWSAGWVDAGSNDGASVQGTTVYEGAKAVKANTDSVNAFYTRALTTAITGNGNIVYFALRRTLNNSGFVGVTLRNSGTGGRVSVLMNSSGNITLNGTTSVTLVTGYSTSQWYVFRLTVNATANTATAATSTGTFGGGGSWSSESSAVTMSNSDDIDLFGITGDANAGTDSIDYISSVDPLPAAAATASILSMVRAFWLF